MGPPTRFIHRATSVVYVAFDGETIIFHLTTGVYYSLTGAGIDIWEALRRGASVDDLTIRLLRRYDVDRAELERAVSEFVSRLEQEQLLGRAPAECRLAEPAEPVNGELLHRFEPPSLNRYDDMQDLLLIDPIHDVEEEIGWPVKKADPMA